MTTDAAADAWTARLPAALDALATEHAVQTAIRAEGHHVATFGVWALRRRSLGRDPVVRALGRDIDWTWLAFLPESPHALSEPDSRLLAELVHRLHGVAAVQWSASQERYTYTVWPLGASVLRGRPHLVPGTPAASVHAIRPRRGAAAGGLDVPLSRYEAALAEATYVERVAAARPGEFTNVDVLASSPAGPVVVEVKRRTRGTARQREPLSLTLTQTATLGYLRQRGCEVHLAILVVPPEQRAPAAGLREGRWHAAAPLIQRTWTVASVDLLGEMPSPTLAALREARRCRSAEPTVAATGPPRSLPTTAEPRPSRSPRRSPQPRPNAALKPPWTLSAFVGKYGFLDVWHPAPVRLGGRTYTSAATAYLAAQTLDPDVRERLATSGTASYALQLARRSILRGDWPELQATAARGILQQAYRGERASRLVATLPLLLADTTVLDPRLRGLQGPDGLDVLTWLRAGLARHEARQRGGTCLGCRYGGSADWAAFVRCTHPEGPAGTVTCVGASAVRGLPTDGGLPVVPVTTPGGRHYIPSEQASDRA